MLSQTDVLLTCGQACIDYNTYMAETKIISMAEMVERTLGAIDLGATALMGMHAPSFQEPYTVSQNLGSRNSVYARMRTQHIIIEGGQAETLEYRNWDISDLTIGLSDPECKLTKGLKVVGVRRSVPFTNNHLHRVVPFSPSVYEIACDDRLVMEDLRGERTNTYPIWKHIAETTLMLTLTGLRKELLN